MSIPWPEAVTKADGMKSRIVPYSVRYVYHIEDADGQVFDTIAETHLAGDRPTAKADAEAVRDSKFA